ncbi:nucleotidyltransferase domain-containing protein [Patescibacteria group bacterium]|nr:nucleotidyltransferase domain-containing protein [Patescibacteria group bacterium]
MIKEIYQNRIKEIVTKNLPKEAKVFVFGSSVMEDHFSDVDIGIVSKEKIDRELMVAITNDLEESELPYLFDVIDFGTVESDFKEKVLKGDILWLT